MLNKKLLFNIFIFMLICTSTVVTSLLFKQAEAEKMGLVTAQSAELTRFEGLHYFKIKDLKPHIKLKATRLDIKNKSELTFSAPEGLIFSKGRNLSYIADQGVYIEQDQQLLLTGNVDFRDKKNTYKSDEIFYDGKKNIVNASGNVHSSFFDRKTGDTLSIESKKLSSHTVKKEITFSGEVQGKLKRFRRYEGSFNFSANRVDLNLLKSEVRLSQAVKITRNDFVVSAESAEIFLENYNKKLKYYSLYDDVKLVEKVSSQNGKLITRRAYAQKLEAFQRTGKIMLTGAPRVEQGDDVIKGYQITLRENVELVEVDDSQSSFTVERNNR